MTGAQYAKWLSIFWFDIWFLIEVAPQCEAALGDIVRGAERQIEIIRQKVEERKLTLSTIELGQALSLINGAEKLKLRTQVHYEMLVAICGLMRTHLGQSFAQG